jgi:hypothetical protein
VSDDITTTTLGVEPGDRFAKRVAIPRGIATAHTW